MKSMNRLNDLPRIRASDTLKARTFAAAQAMRTEGQEPRHKRAPWLRQGVVAACICAVVIGSIQMVGPSRNTPAAIANSFGLVAYAAETGETKQPEDGQILFYSGQMSGGENGYFIRGTMKITGENITSVQFETDRGKVFRQKHYEILWQDYLQMVKESDRRYNTEDKNHNEYINGDLVYSVTERLRELVDDDPIYDVMTARLLDNNESESYNPAHAYGLWLDFKTVKAIGGAQSADAMDGTETQDSEAAYDAPIDYFDGAMVKVIVTFSDGTAQTKTLRLKTGDFRVKHPQQGLLGSAIDGQSPAFGEPYTHSIYAEIEG